MAYVDLDERAIDALREFNEEGALTVLQQFKESDLSHVQVSVCKSYASCPVSEGCLPAYCEHLFFFFCLMQNKSAFLCGVMKTYRQREKQGSKVQDSNKGPDEAKIKVNCVLLLLLLMSVIGLNQGSSPSKVLFIVCFLFLSVCRHC